MIHSAALPPPERAGCAIGGPLLLLVGLGVVVAEPMTIAGGTLTLTGAILISAVVQRGA